jgi:hypothetical protein
MILDLIRLEQGDEGTYGVLRVDGKVFCVTLELPWKNNARGVSCIPEGFYPCARVQSPKFKEVFEIQNVPGRSAILIHAGNFTSEIQGCVLLGTTWLDINKDGRRDVTNSTTALFRFMEKMKGQTDFWIRIRSCL